MVNSTPAPALSLTGEERQRLRAGSDAALAELERQYRGLSWQAIAAEYFQAQRFVGHSEMAVLIESLGLVPPLAADDIRAVLTLATDLFLGTAPGDASLRPGRDGTLLLRVRDCPVYQRLLQEQPLHAPEGMTACSCASRRLGWYDALRTSGRDELLSNVKWGHRHCAAAIHLE